ncbi:MAG: response regulator [Chromatiales bacterium]|nr:response regulator [Chromatiales bacterium]
MRRPGSLLFLPAAALLAGFSLPAQAMPELLLSAGLQWWVWLALLVLAIFLTVLAAVLLIPENGPMRGPVGMDTGLADLELCAGNCRVLVVDDNLTGQLVLRRLLEQVGYVVDVAGDGREAVNRCRTTDYVAVFMDIRMPVLDGCSATRLIRALPAGESLPVIGVTAGDRDSRRRCLEAGMNDFEGRQRFLK